MQPIQIVCEVTIASDPETIWRYWVDWENLGDWMEEASDVVVTSDERVGVGVTAEATIRIGGIKTTDAVRVSRWEPPLILEIEHLGWVKGSGLLVSEAKGDGTHITWKETLHPPMGPVGAIGMRLFKPLMRRIFQRDLDTLKRLVERAR